MRCSNCRQKYRASWAQPAPGGTGAPGVYFLATLVLLAASIATLLLELHYAGWTLLVLAWLVAFRIPIAWSECRRKFAPSDRAGETCPKCGAHNPIRPWSF